MSSRRTWRGRSLSLIPLLSPQLTVLPLTVLPLVTPILALSAIPAEAKEPYKKPPTDQQRLAFRAQAKAARELLDNADNRTLLTTAKAQVSAIDGSVTALKSKDSADAAALAALGEIKSSVDAVVKAGSIAKLPALVERLEASQKELVAKYAPYDGLSEKMRQFPELAADIKLYGDLAAAFNEAKTATGETSTALGKSLKSVSTGTEALVKRLGDKAQKLEKLAATADHATVRVALARDLDGFQAMLKTRQGLTAPLDALQTALKSTKDPALLLSDSLTKSLDGQIVAVLGKLPPWLEAQFNAVVQSNGDRRALMTAYLADPGGKATEAAVAAKLAVTEKADLDKIAAALVPLLEILQGDFPIALTPSGFIAADVAKWKDGLTRGATESSVLVTVLTTAVPVDKNIWVAENIPLYYFDDVSRLMNVLNRTPVTVGGDSSARQRAIDGRAALDAATNTLIVARTRVNDARTALDTQRAEAADRLAALKRRATQLTSALSTAQNAARRERDLNRTSTARLALLKNQDDLAKAKLDRATAAHDKAEAALTAAQTTADANKDPTQQARLDAIVARAQNRESGTAAALAAAQGNYEKTQQSLTEADATSDTDVSRLSEAEADATAVKARNDQEITEIKTQESAARSELAAAETEARTAEGEVRTAAANAFLLANQENAAYAAARDNTPFLMAVPEAAGKSSDPLERVFLCGFADDKSMLVRGTRDDVNKVRELIANFDKPRGQALMTLWTLELSSDATPSGRNAYTTARRIIESEQQAAHDATERANSNLRHALSDTLDYARAIFMTKYPTLSRVIRYDNLGPLSFYDDNVLINLAYDRKELYNLDLYELQLAKIAMDFKGKLETYIPADQSSPLSDSQTNTEAGFNPENADKGASKSKVLEIDSAPLNYETRKNQILKQLITRAIIDLPRDAQPLRGTAFDPTLNTEYLRRLLPQPENTTTIAQALVVLSLAKRDYQLKFLERFLEINRENPPYQEDPGPKPVRTSDSYFAGLRNFVGQNQTVGADLQGFQREVINALLDNAKPSLVTALRRKAKAYQDDQSIDYDASLKTHDQKLGVLMPDLLKWKEGPERNSQVQKLLNSPPYLLDIATYAVDGAADATTVSPDVVQELKKRRNLVSKAGRQKIMDEMSLLAGPLYHSRHTSPATILDSLQDSDAELVAKAKGYRDSTGEVAANAAASTAALDEMLKKALRNWNDDLQNDFVRPRLDAISDQINRGKNHVGVGILTETSVLTTNRQASRVDPQGSAQVAMGDEMNILEDALDATKLYAAVQTGGATAALGGLDALPREAPPRVYGISSGNVFEVRPIADPTGQAAHFKLDFVSSTRIREPNGSIDPQLPRIERHGLNAPIQLSNNETRLVSRFGSNSRLGLPPRKSGGIPILKDLPVIKEVPLLGWFSKRGGTAAVQQSSFIFAQAAMFPSAPEVLELLTRALYTSSLSDASNPNDFSSGKKSKPDSRANLIVGVPEMTPMTNVVPDVPLLPSTPTKSSPVQEPERANDADDR